MKTRKKESHHILLGVVIAMILVLIAWLFWFYPSALKNVGDDGSAYSNFKSQIQESLSVFKPATSLTPQNIDVDDLRERVFGDSIKK
jgi:ammonia channel protein AmtB